MSTCMFYNYCVCRSTVIALCALLSCSAAICQKIMSMWSSIWTNKWWWWWWWFPNILYRPDAALTRSRPKLPASFAIERLSAPNYLAVSSHLRIFMSPKKAQIQAGKQFQCKPRAAEDAWTFRVDGRATVDSNSWLCCRCLWRTWHTGNENRTVLTLSPLTPLRLCTLPYWSNPPFLISDIRTLWRSRLSARAPECQKLKMAG